MNSLLAFAAALGAVMARLCRRPVVVGSAPRNRIASVRGLRRPSRPVVTTAANAIRTQH